jgi:hypothetical protein
MSSRAGWVLIGGLVLTVGGGASAQQGVTPVPVFVNGGRLGSDAYLLKTVGRSVLPMRTLFESLGAHVEWDGNQRAVYAWRRGAQGIRLGLGERSAQQLRMSRHPTPGDWGEVVGSQKLDAPAMMIDGRVFVPLRFASEALSADVRYAASEPAVYIKTGDRADRGDDTEPPRRPDPDDNPRPPRRPRPDRDGDGGRPRPGGIAQALDLVLRVPERPVDRDQPVRFDLVVTNKSRRPVTIPFNTGQRFDFEVEQEGKLIWNWANQRLFTQMVSSVTLNPGESKEFTARWDFRSNRDVLVQPGRYLVRATLTAAGDRRQITAEEHFDVTR